MFSLARTQPGRCWSSAPCLSLEPGSHRPTMAAFRRLLLAAALSVCCAGHGHRSKRVAEGDPTGIKTAPWLVQIEFYSPKNPEHVKPGYACAASIVDETHVISAAHCFETDSVYYSDPSEYLAVLVGTTDKLGSGMAYSVQSVVIHPKFEVIGDSGQKQVNQKYDLAVLTLEEPIIFDDTVMPIRIASQRVEEGKRVVVGGWGMTTEKEPGAHMVFAPTLKTAVLEVYPRSFCEKHLGHSNMHRDAAEALVCAKPLTGSPCEGDSGSGLWVTPLDEGEAAVLVGVVEGGRHCSLRKGLPVFVDITDPELKRFLVESGVTADLS